MTKTVKAIIEEKRRGAKQHAAEAQLTDERLQQYEHDHIVLARAKIMESLDGFVLQMYRDNKIIVYLDQQSVTITIGFELRGWATDNSSRILVVSVDSVGTGQSFITTVDGFPEKFARYVS